MKSLTIRQNDDRWIKRQQRSVILLQQQEMKMNVANLQIEGLCMAIIAINHALGEKGVLTQIELNGALKKAEEIAQSGERFVEDLNPSSRDAVCFPIRILEAANKETTPRSSTISELAKIVGETKVPYNDMY